ncbi:hypothetical protein SRHO_G00074400 [Serrasalmus rhombeus]
MLLTFYLLFIGLHVSEEGPPTTTPTRAVVSVQTRPATSTTQSSQNPDEGQSGTNPTSSIMSITPATQAPIRRRRGQTESRDERRTKTEQKTQDEVTYSTVVHSNATTTPTVIGIEEKAEYATIRVN